MQSSLKIIDDLAWFKSRFFFFSSPEIFSSLEIVFFEKSALAFSFKFNIDKSDLPFELKTIISQDCRPSSLIISILSSGKTSNIDRPPLLQNIFQPLVVMFLIQDFLYLY